MKNAIIFSLAISIAAPACKKEKEAGHDTVQQGYATYMPLKAGNYWIYQHFDATQSGRVTPLNKYDSSYVEKDTIINGRTYFKVYHKHPHVEQFSVRYLRDSLHYIVNSYGTIEFSSADFATVFHSGYYTASPGDTICSYANKMEDKNMLVMTPAGVFPTSAFRSTLHFYKDWVFYNLHERQFNRRYSEGVGMITEDIVGSVADSVHLQKQLIRYHLN